MKFALDQGKMKEFDMPGWHVFASNKYLKSTNKSDDFGITGKYLFFHTNPELLEKIARDEIENNGFDVAKISAELGNHKDYVLCLYSQNDSRKDELAKKHQEKNGIRYRYWKSDEDTLKGNYSKQYLDKI